MQDLNLMDLNIVLVTIVKRLGILDSLTELIKEIPSEAQILLIPRAVDCERSIRPMINKIQEDDPLKEVSNNFS